MSIDWNYIRDQQIAQLEALQPSNRDILVQVQSGRLEPWITLKQYKEERRNAHIKFRSVLENELIFEIDNDDWKEMAAQSKRIYDWLKEHKAPVSIIYTGNKSIHLRVFFDPTTIQMNDEVVKGIKEYGLDVLKEVRLFFYELVKKETNTDPDRSMFAWGASTKGHMERMEGSLHEKTMKFCSLIDKIPDEKPSNYPLKFMDPTIRSWDISNFAEDINARLKELLDQLKKEEPGAQSLAFLEGVAFDIEQIPCIKKMLEKGFPRGHRHEGCYSIATLFKRIGIPVEKAKETVEVFLRHSEDFNEIKLNAELKNTDSIYANKDKRFSCGYMPKEHPELCDGKKDKSVCPVWKEIKLMKENEKGNNLITLGSGVWVEKADDGIYWIAETKQGTKRRKVIGRHFDVLNRYEIDGQTVFKFKTEREEIATFEQMVALLKSEGCVLDHSQLNNAVSAITNEVRAPKVTHSTIGVYDEKGKLILCLDPVTLTNEQANIMQKLTSKGALKYVPSREDVEAYLKFIGFFKKYEIYPIMGFAAVAPFSLLFKRQNILVPILFVFAKEMSVGKSKAIGAFSQKMFGADITSADKILSDFRFNEIMDSACLPLGFDEGEKINFDKMVVLREACENEWLSARGKSNLTLQRYKSRAMPIFTGNDFNAKKPETLKRMVIIHFDEQRKHAKDYWERKKEFDRLYSALKPVGYDLIKNAVEEIQTTDELFRKIYSYADKLENEKTDWVDPTKPKAWAICYLGLKLWENYAKKMGIAWEAPGIKEFIDIVNTVECSTWETTENVVADLRDWLELWITKHRDNEGELWKEGSIAGIEGYFITRPVLREYNNDRGSDRISNLKRINEAIMSTYNIPANELFDEKGFEKVTKIGGAPKRVAFIPKEGHGVQNELIEGLKEPDGKIENDESNEIEKYATDEERDQSEGHEKIEITEETKEAKEYQLVQALKDMPSFVDFSGHNWSRGIRKGEIFNIDSRTAELLIKRGVAKQIRGGLYE